MELLDPRLRLLLLPLDEALPELLVVEVELLQLPDLLFVLLLGLLQVQAVVVLHQGEQLLAPCDFLLVYQPALLILPPDVVGLVVVLRFLLVEGLQHCGLLQLLVDDGNGAEYQLAERLLVLRF